MEHVIDPIGFTSPHIHKIADCSKEKKISEPLHQIQFPVTAFKVDTNVLFINKNKTQANVAILGCLALSILYKVYCIEFFPDRLNTRL